MGAKAFKAFQYWRANLLVHRHFRLIMTCEEIDEFQGAILRSVGQHTAPYQANLMVRNDAWKGLDFTMFPETFNPNYAKAALLLLDNLGVRKGDVVLDPFAGCGADAIFAVREGAARAVAIEKHELPFLCASYNAYMLGKDSVDVRKGDLFDPLHPVEEDKSFSLVVANPPFRDMKSEFDKGPDWYYRAMRNIDAAIKDPGYRTLTRFFTEVGSWMAPEGRIRMVFSDVGDMDFLQELAGENGFSHEVVAEDRYATNIRIAVYEMRKS